MGRFTLFLILTCFMTGCATPLMIENGTQSRTFTPCTNDALCFRDSYHVAWDNGYPYGCQDFPVSYRSKQTEYESNRVEYILLPPAAVANQAEVGGGR
ncbi:MAG: hypothetical protein PHI31_17765 [Desulfuromonadaceae bacterium]|nr:hypothetical protein [Desulfuromonadaceae bacterium]